MSYIESRYLRSHFSAGNIWLHIGLLILYNVSCDPCEAIKSCQIFQICLTCVCIISDWCAHKKLICISRLIPYTKTFKFQTLNFTGYWCDSEVWTEFVEKVEERMPTNVRVAWKAVPGGSSRDCGHTLPIIAGILRRLSWFWL